MNRILIALFIALLSGCARPPAQPQQASRIAVDSLNQQIEKFNSERDGNTGISPIEKRVSRVKYDSKSGRITTFDQDGNPFIILQKEADGTFKGVLKQPYHQLAFSEPDGSHSWGHILAEFYLEKGIF
jgi:hypothetical protein